MSSHHIIRDNQEPALVLIEPLPWEQLSALLEWSPTIYVEVGLLDWIESLGIKVDFIFGDISEKAFVMQQLSYQQPISFLEISPSNWPALIPQIKNNTIHVSANWENIQIPDGKTLIFFRPTEKIYLVKSHWQKWLNQNDTIKVVNGEVRSAENLKSNDGINYYAINHGLCKIEANNELWLSESIA